MIKIMLGATETPLADVGFPEVVELHDAFGTFSRTHLSPSPIGVLCLEKTGKLEDSKFKVRHALTVEMKSHSTSKFFVVVRDGSDKSGFSLNFSLEYSYQRLERISVPLGMSDRFCNSIRRVA